ncbi:MAG: hypothetical protein KAG19_00085 [Methylococcales bacterium]|nr:hypothetical protein [Methylococcales bacterium]
MAEKTISKYLTNLEQLFSRSSPILHKTSDAFHELDQLEYDLGLIDRQGTTAIKNSWWPTVSLVGGFSTAKLEFVNRYLDANTHASNHKFTVHQYTPQSTPATLPGTALDVDHRLPFYQVSQKIEQLISGEGSRVNAYLELKTVNSDTLKGKLFINTPVLSASSDNTVQLALTQHVLQLSDVVLVFTDLFDAEPTLTEDIVNNIIDQQDTNKFIYVIDHSEITVDAKKADEIIATWQRKLAEIGIHTGQFVVLSDESQVAASLAFAEIDQRLENIEHDRSYRVLDSLEKSIRNINDIYIPEVEKALSKWKDRSNISSLVLVGVVVLLLVFAEISTGIVIDSLFDPIIGPSFIVVMALILVPLHILISKVHAKYIIAQLQERQKELNINENLSGFFEKSLTFWRIILPIKDPVGKNKKTRSRINRLIEQTKNIVQALNDQFSHNQLGGGYNSAIDDISNPFDN